MSNFDLVCRVQVTSLVRSWIKSGEERKPVIVLRFLGK